MFAKNRQIHDFKAKSQLSVVPIYGSFFLKLLNLDDKFRLILL